MLSLYDRNGESSLVSIWKDIFPVDLFEVLDVNEIRLLEKVCFSYILDIMQWPAVFRTMDPINKKLTEAVKAVDEKDSAFECYKRLRRALIKNYDFIIRVKFYILRLAVKDIEGMPLEIEKEKKWCKIPENETAVWHNLQEMGVKELLYEQIKNNDEFEVPTFKQLKKDLDSFIRESETYIRKQVLAHLRFIYKPNNMQWTDMAQILVCYATEAYYLKTPWLPKAHVENTARAAIANGTRKIIGYYTSEDRARLYSDGGEYKNRIIKDSDIGYGGKGVYATSECMHTDKDIVAVDRRLSLRISYKKKEALSLIMMEDDDEFIAFCKRVYKKTYKSCEDAYYSLGRSKYFGAIVAFLGIPLETFKSLLAEIKTYVAVGRAA